jgi:hypothetical protein
MKDSVADTVSLFNRQYDVPYRQLQVLFCMQLFEVIPASQLPDQ